MRLIDAEQFAVVGLKGVTKDFTDGVEYILEQIDNAPVVDAVEVDTVVEMLYREIGDRYACNVNDNVDWKQFVKHYCGAKMDGDS